MIEKITSLEDFLKTMEGASKEEYTALAKRLEIPTEDFKPYMFWDASTYTRNCIVRTERYELILLCWEPTHETPIHCHGGEECWVKMLQGTIEEKRFLDNGDDGEPIQNGRIIQKAPNLSYMNDDMGFHSLHNIGQKRAMSLHMYMNPIDACRVFDEDKEVFIEKTLQYFSYQGKILEAVGNN